MRLFAGIALPEFAVERLSSLRLRLSAPGDGLRWSVPEQWHITLKFFGDVPDQEAGGLGEALAGAGGVTGEVVLRELGLFVPKGILYVAMESSATLDDLHRRIEMRTAAFGVRGESRAFRPHITLARSKGTVGAATLRRFSTPALPSLGAPLRWRAEEILLYRSILTPGGAEYTVLARVALCPPAY